MPLPAQAHFEIFRLSSNFQLLEMQICALWTRSTPGKLQHKTRRCHPWFYHLLTTLHEGRPSSPSSRELLTSVWWSHIRLGGKLGSLSSVWTIPVQTFPLTSQGGETFGYCAWFEFNIKERSSSGAKFPFWGHLAAASLFTLIFRCVWNIQILQIGRDIRKALKNII